jgi:hypothetical protein
MSLDMTSRWKREQKETPFADVEVVGREGDSHDCPSQAEYDFLYAQIKQVNLLAAA